MARLRQLAEILELVLSRHPSAQLYRGFTAPGLCPMSLTRHCLLPLILQSPQRWSRKTCYGNLLQSCLLKLQVSYHSSEPDKKTRKNNSAVNTVKYGHMPAQISLFS